LLLLSTLLILSGVDPVSVVEYSIVFAVVTLPFTYFPMLVNRRRQASDEELRERMAVQHARLAVFWFSRHLPRCARSRFC
jgi:Mn2+/Fe2+ NRAMP family transporter